MGLTIVIIHRGFDNAVAVIPDIGPMLDSILPVHAKLEKT